MCADWVEKETDRNRANVLLKGFRRATTEQLNSPEKHYELAGNIGVLIKCNHEVPEYEKSAMVIGSLVGNSTKADFSADELLIEIARREKAFLAKPKFPYQLVTTISLTASSCPIEMDVGDVHMSISSSLPQPLLDSFNIIKRQTRGTYSGSFPGSYAYVTVGCLGRSPADAGENALDGLDFFRSVLNYSINGHRWRISSGKWNCANLVVLGPVHSVHDETGALVPDVWFYEPTFSEASSLYDLGTHRDEFVAKLYPRVAEGVTATNYAEFLRDSFVAYTRALDQRDWYSSFLQLWAVLERITGSSELKSDRAVQRASFFFKDPQLYAARLLALKRVRNTIAHDKAEALQIETLLYQLKSFVEHTLGFHYRHGKDFKSFGDLMAFLDLSPNLEQLQRERDMRERAIHFFETGMTNSIKEPPS